LSSNDQKENALNEFDKIDPYNPTPVGPGAYDQYGNAIPEPVESARRAPYILFGILATVGVIGGLLYFTHNPATREQQAQVPISQSLPLPASTTTPTPAGLSGSGAHTGSSGASIIPDTDDSTTSAPSTSGTTRQ